MDSKIRMAVFASMVALVQIAVADIRDCGDGYYFSFEENDCVQCSECSGNLIIRTPCSMVKDTICGPFVEFNNFLQRPRSNTTLNWGEQPDNQQTQYPTSVDKDRKWYTLAMALLGILSVISVFGVVYIVVVCFVCKNRRQEKEISYDSELGHPSRLCQTTRLVEPNVYVNSRDRLRAGRPYTVPEEGEEFSGENSNQTMSSMSSHYVYFKTAETDTEPPNE